MRLDRYLQEKTGFSRAQVQKMIKGGFILVNSTEERASYTVKNGDNVQIDEISKVETELKAEDIDLDVLYEDKGCLVICKPAGMVVHPGEGGSHSSGTLANAILSRVDSGVGEVNRPGIVHRLDKDTSGCLVVAKNLGSYTDLIKQFKNRTVEKKYIALLCGKLLINEGIVESPIGRSFRDRKKMSIVKEAKGKEAVSRFKLKEVFEVSTGKKVSLVEVEIMTGRTHQIRLHMKSIGHAVVGDIVYGDRNYNKFFKDEFDFNRQFLHAAELKFDSFETGKRVSAKADLTADLKAVLEKLRS